MQDLRSVMPGGNSKRSRNQIKFIVRHHSATTSGNAQSFANYHVNHHGWSTSGYHEVILRDGTVQLCYDPEVITNGVGRHNTPTYHICVVGNGSFTEAQERAWRERAEYNINRFDLPISAVRGHNEFSGHERNICPGINMFNVRNDLRRREERETQIKSDVIQEGLNQLEGVNNMSLKRGDKGAEVKKLQNDLLKAGEKLPRFGADGDFGAETEAAVQSFQRKHGISSPQGQHFGVAGPATLAKLAEVLNVKPSAEFTLGGKRYRIQEL